MSHGNGKTYPTPPRADGRRVLGHSVSRLEDMPLVTGQGRFAGDINFPHQLHMRIVRSPAAHGKLNSVDASAALALPGVVAVWTNTDIADLSPIDFRADKSAEVLKPYRQPALARGRVRYVGDPVAAVFAEDPYIAEDAAELVTLDIESLSVLMSASDKPGEFEPGRSSEAGLFRHSYGDIEAAFRNAHTIIELDLTTGRHSGVPMETRGAIGRYDAARDLLELHGAAKIPHRNKETLCRMLGRSPSGLHVHESHVGGGFGIRGEIYPEDVLVLIAAQRLGRPVKWIEDRREHLMCANQGREQRHLARIAVDSQGLVLGIEDEIFHDQGAYVRTHGANVPNRTMCMLTGAYKVPAYRAVAHFRLTNKTPAATYRAPGRFESTFVRSRLMDAVADKLGIDRIEVRKRNLIPASELPYTIAFDEPGVEELELDSGDYALLLDKALAAFGWDTLQQDLKRRRAAGEAVGAGVAIFMEESGRGPADNAKIAVDTSGAVELITGGASLGQGFETAMAQICAEALGVDYRRVRVIHGHTDLIDHGIGAHATRATGLTGGAVHNTALMVRAKALEFASELLQTPAAELDIVDGTVARRNNAAGPSITLAEIAKRIAPGSKLLRGRDPQLAAHGWFNTSHTVFPYGVHLAVVRIDRETGHVAVERFLVAYDVGRAVNPMMIEGQLVGGCVQGLGGALYEEFVYDDNGEPLAATLADYLIPTLRDTPHIEVLLTEDAPSPHHPLGLKGAGEGGINGAGGVIAGAIDDALGMPGAITRLPVTPQRLREILRQKSP
ncbi:MAG: aerobic carbon-monoxide dehydrogenase large subunit, partial [Alphaproteobacteria bacterium]|jgi:carbon-monoxide dehydrogenase large subunit/6-hydroxypseudooxynicotine dehydrogenase subunit gamma|nr:aerobic carbon-monoxide dehydrogenase large subunit [Alphaproteobacteria bacterium]